MSHSIVRSLDKHTSLSVRKIVVVLGVLLFAVGTWLAPGTQGVSAQTVPRPTPMAATDPSVTVSGTGQVEAQPDRAVVTLGVETQSDSASAAIEQNNQQMQAVVDALTEAGVASDDIQTQAVRLEPIYSSTLPPSDQAGALTGYRATNVVEVVVQQLDQLGELLDAAVQAGSNRIQGIRFEVSDPENLLNEARDAAWNQARERAEQLASFAGAELGIASAIQETSGPSPVYQEAALSRTASDVPISPGTQTIEASLQVTWQLVYPDQ